MKMDKILRAMFIQNVNCKEKLKKKESMRKVEAFSSRKESQIKKNKDKFKYSIQGLIYLMICLIYLFVMAIFYQFIYQSNNKFIYSVTKVEKIRNFIFISFIQ
ncbi:hypothetical protein ABPG72_015542 [Tetrahymena utriculariae]